MGLSRNAAIRNPLRCFRPPKKKNEKTFEKTVDRKNTVLYNAFVVR